MLVVLGSTALNHYKFVRTPVDLDILGTYDEVISYINKVKKTEKILAQYPIDSGKKIVVKTDKRIIEAEIAWPDSNALMLFDLVTWAEDKPHHYMEQGQALIIPSLDVLYTLKMSHRYRKDSVHFLKTLDDILLMRKLGAKIPEEYLEWYEWRQKDTYTNTLPKLNQSKKDFFDNSSNIYTLQHDDIHEAVKHLDKPAYEYFKQDAAEVFTSKSLFENCSRDVQMYAAIEEVMVLSIERSIHPFPNVNRKWAFDMALMKLSTSISSGWFREFVWENYYEIQEMYSEEYVDKFYKALHNGLIKPFKE